MIEYLLKKLLSFVITLVTLFAPESKYQKALDEMPGIPERVKGKYLSGWLFNEVRSAKTDEAYYYFEYPTDNKDLPVLLCLHGFNTDGSVFFNMKTLSDKYRIIAFNLPERSRLYQNNIRDFEQIIDDFCVSRSISNIALLGYSIGGGIALSYAANTRQVSVQKLILISTTVFGATSGNQKQIRGMADRLLEYPDYKLYALLVNGGEILKKVEQPEVSKDVPKDGIVIKHVDWYKQILKSFYWYNGPADAIKINCPVIVIHGQKDKLMNEKEIAATKHVFPNAHYYLLQEAAHSLIWSHAKEVDNILRND
jgi:pimeloyl-ACP methyl ester carboxylesterase